MPSFIGALINLAQAVGGMSVWRIEMEAKTRILKSVHLATLILGEGPKLDSAIRPFHWLPLWINHYKLSSIHETPESLYKKAWDSLDELPLTDTKGIRILLLISIGSSTINLII